MEKKRFTISVFTEDVVGILNRVSIIFTRRKINVESIAASGGNVITEDIKEGCSIIEKQAELLKIKFGSAWPGENRDTEIVSIPGLQGRDPKEISLKTLSKIINARVVEIIEQVFLEKTGHKEETQQLFDDLKPFGILEFVRSGRVAITKPMKTLSSIVEQLEKLVKN